MRTWTTLLLVLGMAVPAQAQVNTEKLRSFDVDGFAAAFDGTVAFQSGNSDLFEVGLSSRFDYRSGNHYTFLLSSVRYGEKSGDAFRNASFGHLRYNLRFVDWLVGEAFGQIENDEFTLLQVRLLGGTGLRFRYFHQGRLGLFQGTTLMLEYENLDAATLVEHPAETTVVRWSNYVNVRLRLNEQTSLINTVYVQPQIDALGDVRILDEATLAVGLTEHLTFTTSFNLRYDSRPPETVESLDLALQNGLVVEF